MWSLFTVATATHKNSIKSQYYNIYWQKYSAYNQGLISRKASLYFWQT